MPVTRATLALMLAASASACSGGDGDESAEVARPTETVTVTASPSVADAESPTSETTPEATFVARYQDVADYVVSRGLPFAVGSEGVDEAIAMVCTSVDGQPVSPQWRKQAVAGLGMGSMGERYFDALVEGCYETGHADRYVNPKPKPTPTPQVVTVPGDGTFEVGVDIPAGTYRNPGAKGPGYYCVAYASTKPTDLTTWLRGSTSKGPAIVTLNRGEFFTTQFCNPFTLSQ